MEKAKEECLTFIDINASTAFDSDGFTDLDSNTLCDVLKRDSLRIKEIDLFHAMMR